MLNSLDLYSLLFCALVVAAAFAVRGGAGFGGGAVAVPLLALVLPLQAVVAVVAVLNALSSIGHGLRDWREIQWRPILVLAPFSLLGVGLGLYLLVRLDPEPLRKGLGIFVILYAAYGLFTAGHAWRISRRRSLLLAAATGVSAGFVGALFGGAAGPIYVIYLNALGLPRDAFRVTITTIMLIQAAARIAGYAGAGFYDLTSLVLLAAALPMMMLGSWLGGRFVRSLDQRRFNVAVSCVLFASGALLLFK